jgi:hypothetical protein
MSYGSHGPDVDSSGNPKPGEPPSKNWKEIADLDNNKIINIIDITKVAVKYNIDKENVREVYDDKNLNVILKIKNTGENAQPSPFVGIEFYKVNDYTKSFKKDDDKAVKAWINIKDKANHGCVNIKDNTNVPGCDCTSTDTEFKKGQVITVNCMIPASHWGETTGNQRIMFWVHERDLTVDAGKDGCGSDNCNTIQGGCPVGQCPGGTWWIDSLSVQNPAGLKVKIITSSGTQTSETLPLSIIRNIFMELLQRVFGSFKTYPTGHMISKL